MKDKDKRQEKPSDDEKIPVNKSIFETSKEARQKAEEEERQRDEERQRILEQKRKKNKEEHDKRLEKERLELLRLKQGIIEESDIIQEEQAEEIKLNFFQKIFNFFYQNKWWLWIALIFAAIMIFLIVQLVTKPRPDVTVLIIGENYALSEESTLNEYIASFADDFNGNGEILVSVCYIPYTGNTTEDYISGAESNLTLKMQSADAVILIGNKTSDNVMYEGAAMNLSEIYPDNTHIDGYKFMLSDTDFAEKIGLQDSQITDDWYISIRRPQKLAYTDIDDMQEVYDRDFVVFDAIIKDLTK